MLRFCFSFYAAHSFRLPNPSNTVIRRVFFFRKRVRAKERRHLRKKTTQLVLYLMPYEIGVQTNTSIRRVSLSNQVRKAGEMLAGVLSFPLRLDSTWECYFLSNRRRAVEVFCSFSIETSLEQFLCWQKVEMKCNEKRKTRWFTNEREREKFVLFSFSLLFSLRDSKYFLFKSRWPEPLRRENYWSEE